MTAPQLQLLIQAIALLQPPLEDGVILVSFTAPEGFLEQGQVPLSGPLKQPSVGIGPQS